MLFRICFNIILPSTPSYSYWYRSFRFLYQKSQNEDAAVLSILKETLV